MPPAPVPPRTDHVHLVAAPAGPPREPRTPPGARRRALRPSRPLEPDDRPVTAWLPSRPGRDATIPEPSPGNAPVAPTTSRSRTVPAEPDVAAEPT
ncbi:MAG: hypothetical protein ACKOOG_11815, partial [Actinomycetota bacterium]